MSSNRCKVEIPNQLPESGLTRVQFKTWKESVVVYLKQNDNFLPFLKGGHYENWKSSEENEDRIEALHDNDPPETVNNANVAAKLAKRQKDLLTLLNMIARKVDQYDYDDVWYIVTVIINVLYNCG